MIAWSPVAAILCLYLLFHPQLIMVSVSSCFASMIGAHFMAVLWFIFDAAGFFPAGFHAVLGVLVMEAVRYAYFRVYRYVERAFGERFKEVVYMSEFSVVPAGIAAGAGWAAAQNLLGYGMLIAYISDPSLVSIEGAWYEDSCSVSIVLSSSLRAFLFAIGQVAWMTAAFVAFHTLHYPTAKITDTPQNGSGTGMEVVELPPFSKLGQPLRSKHMAAGVLGGVVVLHLMASLVSLIDGCAPALLLLAVTVCMSLAAAVYVAKLAYRPFPEQFQKIRDAELKRKEELERIKNKKREAPMSAAEAEQRRYAFVIFATSLLKHTNTLSLRLRYTHRSVLSDNYESLPIIAAL